MHKAPTPYCCLPVATAAAAGPRHLPSAAAAAGLQQPPTAAVAGLVLQPAAAVARPDGVRAATLKHRHQQPQLVHQLPAAAEAAVVAVDPVQAAALAAAAVAIPGAGRMGYETTKALREGKDARSELQS